MIDSSNFKTLIHLLKQYVYIQYKYIKTFKRQVRGIECSTIIVHDIHSSGI